MRCSGVEEHTNGLAVDERTHIHEPFLYRCRRLAHECAKALERTHAALGFLLSQCVLALELCPRTLSDFFSG